MKVLLLWIAPPLVGAIIGYVTNAIAIKMLFRPLREWRVFGIRIPFTPGILPKQRRKLAVNIGKMVSRELLTEAIVRERIRSPDFQKLVEHSISENTEKLLASSIDSVASFASDFSSALQTADSNAAASDLGRTVGTLVDRFVVSESFATLVRTVIRHAAEKLGSMTLDEILGKKESGFPDISALLERLIASFSTPETEKRVADAVKRFLNAGVEEGTPLGSFVPDTFVSGAVHLTDLLYPIAVDAALRFLNQKSTREELESKGKVILRDAILELNVLQRFFVSAGQYDRTLNERMPVIIDGFVARIEETVKDDATRRRFAEAVRHSVENILSKPADKALALLKTDSAALSRLVAEKFVSMTGSPENRTRLLRFLLEFFSTLEKEPIEKIMRDRLGVDPAALADMASFALVAYLRAESPAAIPHLVDGFLREHGSEKLSFFLNVDETEKTKLDAMLARKAVALFDDRISAVIKSLDIQKMVADRIDTLDMEDVERIVLDVLADQLKWIDIFGAFLGAIMGLSQSLLSLFLGR